MVECQVVSAEGFSIYPEHGTDLNQLFTLADSQRYTDEGLSKAETSSLDQEQLEEAFKWRMTSISSR